MYGTRIIPFINSLMLEIVMERTGMLQKSSSRICASKHLRETAEGEEPGMVGIVSKRRSVFRGSHDETEVHP